MPPALLSRFIADGLDGVYAGEVLSLYARCGSDAARRDFADHVTSLKISTSGHRTPACDAAYSISIIPGSTRELSFAMM